ncbi:kelch-like protein 10 [Rana temporaria]|uniref:kelch-like protein 10 n=1 Tax=Rana temporaria TaxID=8407 RepID=UPI001AADB482|nr:kelch-like protein 10 [Rana temporaria]
MSGNLSSTANCQFSGDRDMSRTGTEGVPGLPMDWDSEALSACSNTDTLEQTIRTMAWTQFHDLRMEDEFCDVTIKVDDVMFRAHKIILSVCSLYFRTLFSERWTKTGKNVYHIPGIAADMMRLILLYAYTNAISISSENVEDLFMAADQFNILGLQWRCSDFLVGHLSPENCVGIGRFSNHFHCPKLHEKTHAYILHHFHEITTTSEELLELSLTEFEDLIKKDELNVKREEAIFETIIKWIEHHPTQRRQHITTLLPKVRMALIHPMYLINNVMTNIHIQHNQECMSIVTSVLRTKYDLNANGSSGSDFMNPLTRPRLPSAILLAVGGYSSSNPTNAMETYDCRVDRWVDITYDMESPRAYHGTAYLNGYVYLVGGLDGINYLNSVTRFDPVRKIWQQVAPMNDNRCYVSTVVLENRLYAMGGFDGHIRLESAECYDPETNQWDLIAPMNEIRSDAKATILNGKIYICGGFNGEEYLFTAEVYNPTTDQWSMIAPMWNQRGGVGVIAYGDLIYAVGGSNEGGRLSSAEVYNPANNSWTEISSMFSPRSNFGIEVLEDLLYVTGGFDGSRTTSEAEYYDRKTEEWYGIHDMNINRSALDCCILPGLPNVREYAASRDTFYREEVRRALSDSSL